jgi:putative NADH-flavin reductase
MKITIFGASGATGKNVVEQALAQGNEVTAFVRNPEKIDIQNDKLTVTQGDVTNAQDVENAVAAVDGVLVTLGASPDMQADIVMEEGTRNIIDGMKKHGVKRIIVQSSYPMSGSREGITFLKEMGMGDEQIAMVQPVLDDKAKQEDAIRNSGLEYTIVRPLMLNNEPKTGEYRVGENLVIKVGDAISRADVADFMLKELTENKFIGKTVTLAY